MGYMVPHSMASRTISTTKGYGTAAQALLDILELNPLQNPPPYEKLVGDLKGVYSRRINIQHRLVYEIFRKEKTVRILRMWTHYD